ncbi:MAG: hypothetical protein ACYDDU_12660 [Dermatophilaceae bacterium]
MLVKMRFVVGVALIWLVAVAGVSATAWVAIERAGRDVTRANVSSQPPVLIGTAITPTAAGSGSTPTPTTPAPTTPAPTAPRPVVKTSATSTSSTAPSPPSKSQTSAVSSATAQDRTVTVTGGQVSVRCIGASITLRIAQPDNGWRVELDASETANVQVTFKRGDTESAAETQVTAVCSAGTPVFTVGSHG